MTSSVLIFFILLVACDTSWGKSQDCSVQKIELICYAIRSYDWSVGNLLTFVADPSMISTSPESSISSVKLNGSEVEKKSLTQFEAMVIRDATVKFLPTGIVGKFPNLKVLAITKCGLVSLNKENLRIYGNKLEELELSENEITSIDADLFEYNSNLKLIILNSLPLRYIEPEFFLYLRHFKRLQLVYFKLSGCINQAFNAGDGHEIVLFQWKNENCADESARIETQNLLNEAPCVEISSTTESHICAIENSTPVYLDGEDISTQSTASQNGEKKPIEEGNGKLDGLKLELHKVRIETSELLRTQIDELSEKMNNVTNWMESKLFNLLSAISQLGSPNANDQDDDHIEPQDEEK